MSLASALRRAAAPATLAIATAFTAANANAAPPAVGQCAPADAVKVEMTNAGYAPLVAFDKTLFKTDGTKVMHRYGLWSNSSLTDGYYITRNGAGQMCNEGRLADIILTDNRERKVDPRTYSTAPKAYQENGLNLVLDTAAKKGGGYPMIQAKVTDSAGGKGVITLVADPTTREGAFLVSNMAGTVIVADILKAGETNGQKYGVQYTPVALTTLDKMKTAEAGQTTAALAALAPR